VFEREPPSEMSMTKHLVKLVAFVKERIPRDVWSGWRSLLERRPRETAGCRSSEGRSSSGLRSHSTQISDARYPTINHATHNRAPNSSDTFEIGKL
jgi:hypothetical protein